MDRLTNIKDADLLEEFLRELKPYDMFDESIFIAYFLTLTQNRKNWYISKLKDRYYNFNDDYEFINFKELYILNNIYRDY